MKLAFPVGPINKISEAFEDDQVQHLKMVKPAEHELLGKINLVRTPINLSLFPETEQFVRAGPGPGQHTVEILREFGLDEQSVRELIASGVVQNNSIVPT